MFILFFFQFLEQLLVSKYKLMKMTLKTQYIYERFIKNMHFIEILLLVRGLISLGCNGNTIFQYETLQFLSLV